MKTLGPIRCTLCVKSSLEARVVSSGQNQIFPLEERVYR